MLLKCCASLPGWYGSEVANQSEEAHEQPMRSRNYAPSVALAPYIARHYILSVDAPASFELIENLLSETAFIRVLLMGDWAAELVPGEWSVAGPMVFFGPNSRPLRVRVRGGFRVVGIAICPAGWSAFSDHPADHYTDRMLALGELWGTRSDELYRAIAAVTDDDAEGDAAIVAAIEAHVSALIAARGDIAAKEAMQHFELIARNDSTALIRDVADRLGLSERQLERNCRACFGMSPKAVLRRSRFLDMATALRGISQPDEQELAALRYYDQSHLTREFRRFITMTPGQFVQTPTPLLTAGLELRNMRKAEPAN
jgi:AraC-like DNA-binding protein